MTHVLSVILVSRMIFNLREAGTEVYEGTEEWRSRIEREVRSIRFRVPTTIHEDSLDDSGDGGAPEVEEDLKISTGRDARLA